MMHRYTLVLAFFVLAACSGSGERDDVITDPGDNCDGAWSEGDACAGSWMCYTGNFDGCDGAIETWSCSNGTLSGSPVGCSDSDTDRFDATDATNDDAPDAALPDADRDTVEPDADTNVTNDAELDTPDIADAGGDDGGITPVAGARLVPEGHALGDLFAMQYIRDTARDEYCDWLPTDDGAWLCVPLSFAEVKYTDASCTEAVLSFRETGSVCTPPPAPGDIVRAYNGASCTGQSLVARAVGQPATADTLYWRSPVDGTCIVNTAPPGTLFAAEPVPSDALVSGTVETRPTGIDGIDIDVILGGDGSRFVRGTRWTDGTACTLQEAAGVGDDVRLCLPDRAAWTSDNTWADAACSEAVYTVPTTPLCGDEPAPTWAIAPASESGCYRPASLRPVADPVAEIYAGSGDACSGPSPTPDTWRSFTAGEALDVADIPTAQVVQRGGGRVTLVSRAGEDGTPRLDTSDWFDASYATWCSPRLFGDGTTRCVPTDGVGFDGLFADDACTVPAYVVFAGGCNRPADAQRIRLDEAYNEALCTNVVTAAYALERHDGPVYSEADGCLEFVLDPAQVAFVDGVALASDAFVELTSGSP